MGKIIFLLAILFLNSCGQPEEKIDVSPWLNSKMSDKEREKIVKEAEEKSFEEVAPVLWKIIGEKNSFRGLIIHPDKPWRDKDITSPEEKAYWMATVVWNYHTRFPFENNQGKVLLFYLKKAKKPYGKMMVISDLSFHWVSEAEKPLAEIVKDKHEDENVRWAAENILLDKVDPNKYIQLAIRLIKTSKDPSHAFNQLNMGNDFFKLNKSNQNKVISLGFQILSGIPEDRLEEGYFVACDLGFFLKIKNKFSPDQDLPKYQGNGSLRKAFFIDTVRNALNWYNQNGKNNKFQ